MVKACSAFIPKESISHGQASVEGGFSVNKNIEVQNVGDNSYIAQPIVCDSVEHVGGIMNIVITKEMKIAASSAHSQHRMHFEQQKKNETVKNKKEKSKASVELISLQEKKIVLEKEIKANELSHKTNLSKDFQLLKKSNELLKIVCESLLREIETNIGEKKKKKTNYEYQQQS